jgi:hypothetical protein
MARLKTVTRRRAVTAAVFVVMTVLQGAAPARADMLPFTAPWQVTLGVKTGAASRSFGFGAPPDGVIQNVTAPIGIGNAEAHTRGIPTRPDSADTKVTFFRPFTLAPGNNYTLTLAASLFGDLNIFSPVRDLATVTADAFIEEAGGPIVLSIDGPLGINFFLGRGTGSPATSMKVDTGVLRVSTAVGAVAPGNYDIFGKLQVDATTTFSTFPLHTNAEANFFPDFAIGGAVSTAPAPPPPAPALPGVREPLSAVLFGIGSLSLLGFALRRRNSKT